MNDDLAAHYAAKIQATLGFHGRMISTSKSGYREQHPDHLTVFNANVCLRDGKIWWGDLDLTLDEPKLVELSHLTRSIVYVLHESDCRFRYEEQPLLEKAVYSVTSTGHTKFDFRYVERDREGVLRERPPVPIKHLRWCWSVLRHRPRLWRFWQLRLLRNRDRSERESGEQRNRLLYVGGQDMGESPFLVLGVFHRRREAVWVEWTWYPARSGRGYAPLPLLQGRPGFEFRLFPFRANLNVWIFVRLWPGFEYSFGAGCWIRRWW